MFDGLCPNTIVKIFKQLSNTNLIDCNDSVCICILV